MTRKPVAAARGEEGAGAGRETDFKQPQQAGAEKHHHQRHRANKPRILELDPPAERLIA